MERRKILIATKTYPSISTKYQETVCTAGVLLDDDEKSVQWIDYWDILPTITKNVILKLDWFQEFKMKIKDIAKIRCILTFGYGNRKDYDAFLEYLLKFNVECVVDVRMVPRAWSRKWYGDKIKIFCELNNIEYISKTALGNTSGKENWIPINQEEADKALHEIAQIAQMGNVLLLCAEMNPNRCHRKEVADCLGNLLSIPVKHLE